MSKITIIVFVGFLAFVTAQRPPVTQRPTTTPRVIHSIDAYRSQHPDSKIVRLVPETMPGTTLLKYTLGTRRRGDTFVSSSHENLALTRPTSFVIEREYPKDERNVEGDFITTYAEIFVDFGSRNVNSYIVSGGIGHRHITILFEVKDARYFQYDGYLYGYPAYY